MDISTNWLGILLEFHLITKPQYIKGCIAPYNKLSTGGFVTANVMNTCDFFKLRWYHGIHMC